MNDNDTINIDLLPGERLAILHAMSNFKGDRTSSVMRKVRRVQHSISFKEVMRFSIDKLLYDEAPKALSCQLSKETLDFLWDIWEKFQDWPSVLAEWVVDAEEKMRLARLKTPEAESD